LIQTEKTSGENLGFFFAFLYEQLLFPLHRGRRCMKMCSLKIDLTVSALGKHLWGRSSCNTA